MDELSVQPDCELHDGDAALARDKAGRFAQELSEEWEPVEPGIYRYAGAARAGQDPTGLRGPTG
jgi:hypothetical protein